MTGPLSGKKVVSGKKAEAPKDITPQQLLFCHEYLATNFNGKKAAINAGYSAKTAEAQASRLLRIVKVAEKIEELKQKRLARADKTANDIIRGLEIIAFSKITDVVSWNESGISFLKNSEDIPPEIAAAIQSVRVTEEAYPVAKGSHEIRTVRRTNVKLHDKLKALETLAKKHGLFKDTADANHPGGVTLVINKD